MPLRTTQTATEVAISREFESKDRVTQVAVETAISREFVSNSRVTQVAVEVILKKLPDPENAGIFIASIV